MLRAFILSAIVYITLTTSCLSETFQTKGTIEAYFLPRGGAAKAIVKEINSAESEILVQAYSFTSNPIAKALVDARKRGIKIEAVLDKSQRREKYTSADFVAHGYIAMRCLRL